MSDTIEKTVTLKAPIERVWRALTDHREFGDWFRVALEGPFQVGEASRGHITYPGYEHLKWEAKTTRMDEPERFAFAWHPYAVDPDADYSAEPPTLVEFRLRREGEGTRLTLTESGFDALPAERRDLAFRMNEGGWTQQVENIRAFVHG
ncbi:MAG: SRPBCC family protein [Caulobacteraceae bacterium]